MKILMLTSVYPHPDDGKYKTTPTVQYFCKEWVRQGHNVIVVHNNTVLPMVIYSLPKFFKKKVERFFQLQIPPRESIRDIIRDDEGVLVFRKKMTKIIPHSKFSKWVINNQTKFIMDVLENKNFIPDVIIGHWANPQAELINALKLKYKLKCKSALVFHNDCTLTNIKKYNLIKYVTQIDHIGCRNKKLGLEIRDNLKLEYDPFICNSGLDNSIVYSTNIEECINSKEKGSILYVGRLQKYKHVDAIVKAINLDNNNNWKFTIVGDGSEYNYIMELIEEYGMKDSFTYFLSLEHKDVFKEMMKNEIFAMISENEVFGMVYFEAMLMGCITIGTRGSAVDGYIVDGVNGFLCGPGDFEELSEIYKKISLMSEEEKKEMVRNGHRTAVELTDENVARKYLNDVMR